MVGLSSRILPRLDYCRVVLSGLPASVVAPMLLQGSLLVFIKATALYPSASTASLAADRFQDQIHSRCSSVYYHSWQNSPSLHQSSSFISCQRFLVVVAALEWLHRFHNFRRLAPNLLCLSLDPCCGAVFLHHGESLKASNLSKKKQQQQLEDLILPKAYLLWHCYALLISRRNIIFFTVIRLLV